jgi:hypothetical protein
MEMLMHNLFITIRITFVKEIIWAIIKWKC